MDEWHSLIDRLKRVGSASALELADGLAAGVAQVTHIPRHSEAVPTAQLARALKRRAAYLSRLATPDAPRLKADTEELCFALSCHPASDCLIWLAEMPPYFSFTVYEDAGDGSCFGVLKVVDHKVGQPEKRGL